MNQLRIRDARKLLIIGVIGAIITVLGGELPIGWYRMQDVSDPIMAQLMGYGSVTDFQLAMGVFFGGIGIALQGFGYEGIARIIGKDPACTKSSGIIHIGAIACSTLGPLVHILAIVLMYVGVVIKMKL